MYHKEMNEALEVAAACALFIMHESTCEVVREMTQVSLKTRVLMKLASALQRALRYRLPMVSPPVQCCIMLFGTIDPQDRFDKKRA